MEEERAEILTDSLENIIKQGDLQRLVLFRVHYKKYMEMAESYERVMDQLELYEDQILQLKERKIDLEGEVGQLSEHLRTKEEQQFIADERLAQLEDEVDRERSGRQQLLQRHSACEGECKELRDRLATLRHEKNELNLRCQLAKSSASVSYEQHTSELQRLQHLMEQARTERDEWKDKYTKLHNQATILEREWRESGALQQLLRFSLQHISSCTRPSCRLCRKVTSAYSHTTQRKTLTSWLHRKYQSLCLALMGMYRLIIDGDDKPMLATPEPPLTPFPQDDDSSYKGVIPLDLSSCSDCSDSSSSGLGGEEGDSPSPPTPLLQSKRAMFDFRFFPFDPLQTSSPMHKPYQPSEELAYIDESSEGFDITTDLGLQNGSLKKMPSPITSSMLPASPSLSRHRVKSDASNSSHHYGGRFLRRATLRRRSKMRRDDSGIGSSESEGSASSGGPAFGTVRKFFTRMSVRFRRSHFYV